MKNKKMKKKRTKKTNAPVAKSALHKEWLKVCIYGGNCDFRDGGFLNVELALNDELCEDDELCNSVQNIQNEKKYPNGYTPSERKLALRQFRPAPVNSLDRDYRLDVSIKEWYEINFPEEVKYLPDLAYETTFRDVLMGLVRGENVFTTIAYVTDTFDKEYILHELSEIFNVRFIDFSKLRWTSKVPEILREALAGIID